MNQAAIRTKEVEICGTELFQKFMLDIHETLDETIKSKDIQQSIKEK